MSLFVESQLTQCHYHCQYRLQCLVGEESVKGSAASLLCQSWRYHLWLSLLTAPAERHAWRPLGNPIYTGWSSRVKRLGGDDYRRCKGKRRQRPLVPVVVVFDGGRAPLIRWWRMIGCLRCLLIEPHPRLWRRRDMMSDEPAKRIFRRVRRKGFEAGETNGAKTQGKRADLKYIGDKRQCGCSSRTVTRRLKPKFPTWMTFSRCASATQMLHNSSWASQSQKFNVASLALFWLAQRGQGRKKDCFDTKFCNQWCWEVVQLIVPSLWCIQDN